MIKLILANKPKYIDALVHVLTETMGNADLLKQPSIAWFLFADGADVVGVAYVYTLSDVRMYVNILLVDPKHAGRKQAGKDLITYLGRQNHPKLEALINVTNETKLRYFSQIGFKREGVSRSSLMTISEDGHSAISDQVHMGLVL